MVSLLSPRRSVLLVALFVGVMGSIIAACGSSDGVTPECPDPANDTEGVCRTLPVPVATTPAPPRASASAR